MTIIGEDEHYIYEEISSNGNTCTIKRTEKPPKQEFARRIDTGAYILIPISTSEEYEDIFKVHFVSKEDQRFDGTYDFKKKEFEEGFQEKLKSRANGTEEEYEEFTENLKKHIETNVEMYRNIEEKIEKLKKSIEERKDMISIFDSHGVDTSDLKSELIKRYDLLQSLQEELQPKK